MIVNDCPAAVTPASPVVHAPVPFVDQPRNEEEKLAFRLWLMRRESVRDVLKVH